MRRVVAPVTVALLVLAPMGARADADCDWPQYGRDAGHSFRQVEECSPILSTSAPTLHLKWAVPASDSVTASPAVVDGAVYVGDWEGVFRALDAEDGSPLWDEPFEIDDANAVAFGRIVSSAAVVEVGGTSVVLFGGGATLYALDAATGDELTRACVDPRADPDPPAEPIRCRGSTAHIEIESSPAVVEVGGETWVVIGMDVHNRNDIGRTGVIAFRLTDDPTWALEPLWKFDPETLETYTGPDLLTHGAGTGDGCGGVWSSPAVDVAADRVFFGTASCPRDITPNHSESMFGIELHSGEYVWHESPLVARGEGTRLDDDFGASPNLLPDELVGFGGKDGWYYARGYNGEGPTDDPPRGWDQHAGQAGHLSTDFAIGGMIGTAAVGDVEGVPAVFATTALSTPLDRPLDEAGPDPDTRLVTEDPGRMFSLHAMRASDGAILWRAPLSRQSYGAPTFVNGVVVVPSTFDLTVKAFHAGTGAMLWAHPVLGAPSSAPVIVGDTIYIGSGTRETDAEYKTFGGDSLEPVVGPHPLSPLSGIFAFQVLVGGEP